MFSLHSYIHIGLHVYSYILLTACTIIHYTWIQHVSELPSTPSGFLSLYRSDINRLFIRVDFPKPDSPANQTKQAVPEPTITLYYMAPVIHGWMAL